MSSSRFSSKYYWSFKLCMPVCVCVCVHECIRVFGKPLLNSHTAMGQKEALNGRK